MTEAPFFSVVMPVFNGARFLPAALASLRAQEPFPGGFEAVAADDGSADGSREMLEEAARDLPLRVVDGARRGNWVASTNKAIGLCSGRMVVFLHQDDAWSPSRLRRLREVADRTPGAGFLANDTAFLGPDGRRVGIWRPPLPPGFSPPERCLPPTIVQNNLSVPGVALRRELLERIGPLDESLRYTADWDAWLRAMRAGGVLRVPETLSFFRVHAGSQTFADFAVRRDAMRADLEAVLARHLPAVRQVVPDRAADRWERLARLGVEADLFLASAGARAPLPWRPFVRAAFRAGPLDCLRFLSVSRVAPRVRARLRAGLRRPSAERDDPTPDNRNRQDRP